MYAYFHIPFCFAKCDYCDFFSIPCGTQGVPNEYLSALKAELAFKVSYYHVQKWDTVYLGGGTPSMLSATQLGAFLHDVFSAVEIHGVDEVTVEMNPESLTEEKLIAAEENGATRLSLGIQSLSHSCLENVHRHCTPEKALAALDAVKRVWHGQLNTDVIAGLPGPNQKESFVGTVEKLLSYNPDHFSLYTLMIEEGTPLFARVKKDESRLEDDADGLWLMGRDMLEQKGFAQYEVSNFAKKGHESRHNFAYWRQADYIGCGAGACGTMYNFLGEGSRLTNTTDIKKYCAFWNSAPQQDDDEVFKEMKAQGICTEEMLPLETEEFEFLMMGLRTLEGVSCKTYRKRFSKVGPWYGDLGRRFESTGEVWEQFVEKKYVHVYKNRQNDCCYALSKGGLLFLNELLRVL